MSISDTFSNLVNESILPFLDSLYEWVWGAPLLISFFAVGLYLTIILRGFQIRYLFYGLKMIVKPSKDTHATAGDISQFEALMTNLASTIGVGSVAGTATAVAIGGMGSLFWMWVMTMVGMATKYAEALLGVKYRVQDRYGQMSGGPMYYISNGIGWKWLAGFFCLMGIWSAVGGGNLIQANSVADVLIATYGVPTWVTGAVLMVLTAFTVLGGIRILGRVASLVVPFMALFYILGGLIIILLNLHLIPNALYDIVSTAFTGQAATGGFIGSTVAMAIRLGVTRGVVTTEAGMGSGAIAAAAAKTDIPARVGLISMAGTFIATFGICTVTALVIAIANVLGQTGLDGRILNGAPMTVYAFNATLPGSDIVVMVGLILFAFTTILASAYYGEKHMCYLFNDRVLPYFRVAFVLMVFLGAVLDLHVVWRIADIANGLMSIPNMIALIVLSPILVKETQKMREVIAAESGVPIEQAMPLGEAVPAISQAE